MLMCNILMDCYDIQYCFILSVLYDSIYLEDIKWDFRYPKGQGSWKT